MARIPIYEQRLAPSGLGVAPRASAPQVYDGIGGALQNAGQALSNFAQQQQRTIEDRAALEAANSLSKGEAYWHEQMTLRMREWKPGDPDLRETIGKDYDEWISSTAAALPTERSRQYFQQQATGMRSRMDRSLFDQQERRTTDVLVQGTQEGMDADFETIYRDPSRRAEVVARRLAVIESQSRIPLDKRMEIGRKYIDQANIAAERSELEGDPRGYYARRFGAMPSSPVPGEGGSSGFDSAVSRLLIHEGGYAENDGNTGAPVNFGINQKANPDIDVKNLTREQAVQIYRTRYWNAINGDTLAPELQGTALDAAANQGPENARKWIAESGGDVVRFNELRRNHYEALLAKPEYARFRRTWMGRLEFYEKQAAGTLPASEDAVAPGAPESFMNLPYAERERLRREVDQRIRQDTAAAAQALRGRLQDSTAMARDGISDPTPLTRDAFAVLGEDGPAAFDEYTRTQVLARDVSAMQVASNQDLMAVASGAARRAEPGPGYAAEDQRDEIRRQAAAQVLRQREADPAGYVARTVPAVSEAARAVFDPNATPEARAAATQNLVTQTLAAQQALGVVEPRVLTAAATEDLARRISRATRPEDAADLVAMLEAEYGKGKGGYFGKVMAELEQAGKLTPALRIIPNLPSFAAREMVSRLSTIKMDDLKTGVATDVQKDVRVSSVDYALELSQTLPPVSNSGAVLLSSYQDMIERIAYERFKTGADRSGSAAAKSAFKILLGHYQFDGTLRLPASVNARQIKSGLSRGLDRDVLPSLSAADVPDDATGAYNDAEKLSQWRDLVRSNAVWYTNSDDDAVQLWVRGDNNILYRVQHGGKQVELTFDKLLTPPANETFRVPDAQGRIQDRPVAASDLDEALASGDMRLWERLKAQQRAEQRQREMEDIRRQSEEFRANRSR
jgi:hypothetical protein